jgi:hypothetical protein
MDTHAHTKTPIRARACMRIRSSERMVVVTALCVTRNKGVLLSYLEGGTLLGGRYLNCSLVPNGYTAWANFCFCKNK